MRRALVLAFAALAAGTPARAMLDTPGFRAVAVARTTQPISALAVAPDGRLFAAIQQLGQTSGATPGTAEIRVFTDWATNDGSTLDTGSVWATVDGVRATTTEEGLLGVALAPDFATSKLVYVYLTTSDENVNQHVRVYRENAGGTGDYLGTVATSLEPPTESTNRNGGGIAFGVDGCLVTGVGDNGSSNRWNAQLFTGTDPIQSAETTALCTNVCLGTAEHPARTIANDGAPNDAGKLLRVAVEGPSTAQPAPGNPFAGQPYAFAAGLRNPTGIGIHPLTGQLWAADRGDGLESELDLLAPGGDAGWPCLEGASVPANAACLVGRTADEVYANHPAWSAPIVSHTGNPAVTGVTVYTGLAYPAEFYGDVFYLMRDSARIYRVDLAPPCFMPASSGLTPLAFHDSTDDGDFRAVYDIDGDGQQDVVSLPVLSAIVQGPSPIGEQTLYVAGKQGTGFTDDSVVYRIEYATAFTPYDGPAGRVPDGCFAGLENPFARTTCLPPGGPCPGQPDGTPCDDGDPCNGAEVCVGGICQHGVPLADGTTCGGAPVCHGAPTCLGGRCVTGAALPDDTPCPDGDPCNGRERCVGGTCAPGAGPSPVAQGTLTVHGAALALGGQIAPPTAIAPSTTDVVALSVEAGGPPLFASTLAHPGSDPQWRRSRPPALFAYRDPSRAAGGLGSLKLRQRGGAFAMKAKAAATALRGVAGGAVTAKVVVGDECYAATLACVRQGASLRCR